MCTQLGVTSARLAIETACGGRGSDAKRRLAGAHADATTADDALYRKRHVAAQESHTQVEQPDVIQAIRAMRRVHLGYLAGENI